MAQTEVGPAVFPKGITAYYGRRRFLMLTRSYVMERAASPYRRLSATLLLASDQPFVLDAGEQPSIESRAVLIAPNVQRRITRALNSDLALFDMPVGSPEYTALEPLLANTPIQSFDSERFKALRLMLVNATGERLSGADVDALFTTAVQAICGHPPAKVPMDPRIEKVVTLIDERPFDQTTLPGLAACLHLSPSRLRHLFKAETGCGISQYLRWVAVWRAAELWRQGRKLTEIAHEVGFYDLSHLDRAFNEVFGWNPSNFIDPEVVTLIRCE